MNYGTCNNMEESGTQSAKWKKPGRKYYICEILENSSKAMIILIRSRSAAAGGQRWRRGLSVKGYEGILGGDENVLYCDCGGYFTALNIYQKSSTIHIKLVYL